MFEGDYPDVLGTITGGERLELETLQCAVGVYPGGCALGQPFEVLVLLQSTIDQPQEVMVAVRLPRKDSAGRRLSFFMAKKQVRQRLAPGEVGVLQIPVVVQPPTPPARGYPVLIQLAAHPLAPPRLVRSPGAGRPPSVLGISPFRLEVLREVRYTAEAAEGQLRARFDVIPGQVRAGLAHPPPKYEALWTAQDFRLEQEKIEGSIALAERVASEFTAANIFYHLEEVTRERYAQAGLPLHPGESLFITKTITYIYEDAYQFERDFELHEARWFQWLCSLLVREERKADEDRGVLTAQDLYFGALYDAVRVALPMVESAIGRRYGGKEEHRHYADKVVQAVQGNAPMDLSYAYLPLVMAGVTINMRVKTPYENLWESLDLLEEARLGRARLSGRKDNPILATVDDLIAAARELLTRSRVPRA